MANVDKMVEQVEHQSRIVSMHIENFMSIKEATITFDERNIVSLCGYNDSGKSAITRLFEIMLYNTYSTDQVKFITDDEEYWLGSITFSDGVIYTRIKYQDGKSLWELTKDGKVLFTNKLPNGTLAAMGDTPEVIVKYLGVIQDELTGEELNVRRNTDRLFLINTTGGDNYKILNSVLRSDVLSSASKSLNEDKNKLNSEVNEKTTVQNVLREQYEEIDVPPVEEIDEVKNFVNSLDEQKGKLARLSLLMDELKTLKSISIYDMVEPVDISRVIELQDIIEMSKAATGSLYSELTLIDRERLQTLRSIIELKGKLNIKTYSELEKIDVERVSEIVRLGEFFTSFVKSKKSFEEIDSQLNEVRKQLKEISVQNNLKICKNCGAVVA